MKETKRPKSITIISILFIIMGSIGVLSLLISLSSKRIPAVSGIELIFQAIQPFVYIISGLGLFKGFNWSRWFYIAYVSIYSIVVWFLYPDGSIVIKLFAFLILYFIFYLLTRPDASAFFKNRSEAQTISDN